MIEAVKRIAALWNVATDEEKKPYNAKNLADKLRVEAQMEEISKKGFFKLADGTKSSDKVVVQKTDLQPKRPKSAYIFYVSEKVGPLMTEKKIKCTEAMKMVSVMWNALSEQEKKPFQDKSDLDKLR